MLPKNKAFLIFLMSLVYIFSPLIEWINYKTNLINGSYSVTQDSIGLPFGMYLVIWLLGLPLLLIMIWLMRKYYPGRVSLLYFNNKRPYWSLVWTIIAIFLISWNLFFIFEQINEINILNIFDASIEIYLILCFKTVLIHKQ